MSKFLLKTKFFIALYGCKLLRLGMKLLGRNATYLPGKIALKICPKFLSIIGKPKKVVAVTGTNGKTTVSNLLVDGIKKHGMTVLDNTFGSNTQAGMASAFISFASLNGTVKKDVAVLEVDERSAMHIFPFICPDIVIITNLFRDSIMRNAHPEYIGGILSANIPKETKLLLNADDLITCSVAPENPRVYYGIEKMGSDVINCVNLINDYQVCPKCSHELVYDYRRYHHIGKAHCDFCDFKSPEYDYSGQVDIKNNKIIVREKGSVCEFSLPSDSIFNIYNVLTAFAGLRELGITSKDAKKLIDSAKIPDSRYNEKSIGDIHIIMQMAKDRNALACSRAFDYVASKPGKKEIIMMMMNVSDAKLWSENICWLYDCDFEFLNNDDITRIVATGPRALDYCMRMRFAGIPAEKIRVSDREVDAPKQLKLEPETTVYILYGTDALDLGYSVRDEVIKRVNEVSRNDN